MSVKLTSKKEIEKMKKQLRALLTGFFTETNTYVAEGTIASFTRTPGDDILNQNRGVNSALGTTE